MLLNYKGKCDFVNNLFQNVFNEYNISALNVDKNAFPVDNKEIVC